MRIPSSSSGGQSCRAKRGLLFLRDCGAEVVATCGKCGRPVCLEHRFENASGVFCPECRASFPDADGDLADSPSSIRRQFHSHYGYRPYYYGSHYYFSDTDYATFDPGAQREPSRREVGEDGTEGDDDPLES